jgi:hypothetical protein
MNKRLIPLILVTLIIIIALSFGVYFLYTKSQQHKVTINLRPGVSASINLLNPDSTNDADRKEIKTISSSTSVMLAKGKYYIIPEGKDYDTTPVIAAVEDKDITVSVNPGYSKDYLARKVPEERLKIDPIIQKAYGAILSDFTLNAGELYKNVDWYGTTLTQKSLPAEVGDVYRLILQKQDGVWHIVAPPKLVLTQADFPKIPLDVLDAVNMQDGTGIPAAGE